MPFESDATLLTSDRAAARLNVADRLTKWASSTPQSIAVACPRSGANRRFASHRGDSGAAYSTITFEQLEAEASRIARGLSAWGVPAKTRLAMLVHPGIEFVAIVFGLLRAGMTIVLVDPGMGRKNLIRCLSDASPEGFIAIPAAQAARLWWRREFPRAHWNVTVGRRWFWGGLTLHDIRALADNAEKNGDKAACPKTSADDPAAIIFTSGSTGVPKGVLYTHRMFDTQVTEIQSKYAIDPGGIDLACFPLFALFNSAMGVTTVLPAMNLSRPASADPGRLLAAANDWRVTQSFASPAVWQNVIHYCERRGESIPSLRQVFSCGAPVPAKVIRATLACVAPEATMHTPYGATECLPVATIEAAEVLNETSRHTNQGAGICVGRKFNSIEWRVIRITDDPIPSIDDAEELPVGEIGELIVRGPQASPKYVTAIEKNALAKIDSVPPPSAFPLPPSRWHRMGDVGYLDDVGRFWYCGRKSQRVQTKSGTLFTEPVEAMFNSHGLVVRSALVGIGAPGNQQPVIVYERIVRSDPFFTDEALAADLRKRAIQNPITESIRTFLRYTWPLPVDVRHNAKINREQLSVWASKQLKKKPELSASQPPAPSPTS